MSATPPALIPRSGEWWRSSHSSPRQAKVKPNQAKAKKGEPIPRGNDTRGNQARAGQPRTQSAFRKHHASTRLPVCRPADGAPTRLHLREALPAAGRGCSCALGSWLGTTEPCSGRSNFTPARSPAAEQGAVPLPQGVRHGQRCWWGCLAPRRVSMWA